MERNLRILKTRITKDRKVTILSDDQTHQLVIRVDPITLNNSKPLQFSIGELVHKMSVN